MVSADSALWLHEEAAWVAETPTSGMVDYKFFCFDGEPRFVYVSQGLEDHSTARISFLNLDWSFASFGRSDFAPFERLPSKPRSYERMLELARELSRGIPFVRVDLFEYQGEVRFSELTFSPCAGTIPFDSHEWDERLGQLLELPAA